VIEDWHLDPEYGSEEEYTESQPAKFPPDWVVDQTRLNRACKQLQDETRELLPPVSSKPFESKSSESKFYESKSSGSEAEETQKTSPKTSITSADYTLLRHTPRLQSSEEPRMMGSRPGGSSGEEDDESGFTPQQQQTLQRMMNEMVRRLTNPQGPPLNPPEPQQQQQQQQEQQQQQQHTQPPVVYGSVRIKPAEIGYFYPDMPSSWGTEGTVDRDEKTYYRTVWAFTNRLKVLASTRDTGQLAQTIESCLKGEAEKW
jgi:hypothetical protein